MENGFVAGRCFCLNWQQLTDMHITCSPAIFIARPESISSIDKLYYAQLAIAIWDLFVVWMFVAMRCQHRTHITNALLCVDSPIWQKVATHIFNAVGTFEMEFAIIMCLLLLSMNSEILSLRTCLVFRLTIKYGWWFIVDFMFVCSINRTIDCLCLSIGTDELMSRWAMVLPARPVGMP